MLRRSRNGEEQLTREEYVKNDMHRDGFPEAYKNNNVSAMMRTADYKIKNKREITDFANNAKILIRQICNEFSDAV